MTREQLEAAAAKEGIVSRYLNAENQWQEVPDTSLIALLDAIKQPEEPEENEAPRIPAVKVFVKGQRYSLTFVTGDYQWQLCLEQGDVLQGELKEKDGLLLPQDLAEGYHTLVLFTAQEQWQCRIIIAPRRCYEPTALHVGKKLWGACIQLYTLRSERNWGIGDFGDLQQMITGVAAHGGAFIGLNPMHALYPADPEAASPYSPSSRRWLNMIYIDVSQVAAFTASPEAQRWWQQAETQQRIQAARQAEWVDYRAVTELKLTALRLAFPLFQTQLQNDPQREVYQQFIQQGGESLRQQALFDALHCHLNDTTDEQNGWLSWPENYQQPEQAAVGEFAEQHTEEIAFYTWLQWLAHQQFAACYQQSQQQQMPIGLYRDLAVGVAVGGGETWGDRSLYAMKASVGAPPDLLGPLGQNWQLPPIHPHVMQQRAYQPFIDLLRANMSHCGALRLDHVMGLLRLWWIPYGQTADQGAYVHYPVDDLLAILALESQRHRCMIMGEDLGIVPDDIVSKLRDSGIYSYKVLYFEQEQYRFRAPQAYNVQAMATLTTHDLPTLRGYWQCEDLKLGQQLGLYPDQQILDELYLERQKLKQGLLDGLYHYGCLSKSHLDSAQETMNAELNRALQRYIADSACALVGLQPEDWLDMSTPVNIPGTHKEYPNWRRKLSNTLEALFSDTHIQHLLKDLNQRRKKASVG